MVRKISLFFFCAVFSLVLFPATGRGQQANAPAEPACPSGEPGVYVHGSGGWHLLAQTSPSKEKIKHAFLSSLSYGAVGAPMEAEYAGRHAAVQVQGAQPVVCVMHIMTSNPPILVRLQQKKKFRELDTGTIRAVPIVGSTKQAKAEAGSVIPTIAETAEDGVTLLRPKTDLAPGEYAVMFGAQNMAILPFGVAAGQ